MKKYKVYQVDAFTTERFRGNPAGVVANAEGLTEEQMLAIARELNNSESAFIFPSQEEGVDCQVRFFTPKTEVPMCGHATVSAHYIRCLAGEAKLGRTIQKIQAGVLPVDIAKDGDDYVITMTQGTPHVGEPFAAPLVGRICEALGITPLELRGDCPVAFANTGAGKIMVPLRALEQLNSLTPDLGALTKISQELGIGGYYVFTLHPGEEYLVHGRTFSPAIGINEDPVTGNSNGPLGAYLVHYGICQDTAAADSFDFKIIQGEALGRRGQMGVHVEIAQGEPVLVQISGKAVVCFATEIEI